MAILNKSSYTSNSGSSTGYQLAEADWRKPHHLIPSALLRERSHLSLCQICLPESTDERHNFGPVYMIIAKNNNEVYFNFKLYWLCVHKQWMPLKNWFEQTVLMVDNKKERYLTQIDKTVVCSIKTAFYKHACHLKNRRNNTVLPKFKWVMVTRRIW